MSRSWIAVAGALALAAMPDAPSAQELRTYQKSATFDDVKLDVTDAITKRGLVVDFSGNVGRMLERTGKDVGSTKPIYVNAEYVTFCSAVLSRQMMEADAANAAFCPYVMFIYETVAKPGVVVVGYRRPQMTGSDASTKALAQVDALLDAIAREATK